MYQAMFEKAGTAMLIIDEDMSVLSINDEFTRLSGYTRGDLAGKKSWTEFFAHDDLQEIGEYNRLRRIDREAVIRNHEARLLDKDGRIKDVIVSANVIPGTDKSIATLVDISECKRAKELYRTMANGFQAGVYIVCGGKIVFANPHIPRYSGYAMEELLGSDILEYVHPADREMVRMNAVRMLKGEQSSPYEFRIIDRNGQVRWLMESVVPIYYEGERAVLGNTMDITETKATKEKLEESKRLESSILASVPHALFGLENRRIIFVNDAVESVFGWKPDELTGKSMRVLFRNDEEFDEIGEKVYAELEKKSCHVRESDFPLRRKDGRKIFCRVTTSRIGDDLENRRVVATFEDITHRKAADDAIRASEERYRGVVDNIAIGVSVINPRMAILDLNKQMRQWFPRVDVSEHPICYKTFNQPPRDNICPHCPTYLTLQDGEVHESITETPVGEGIRNFRIISSPIKDEDGHVTAAIKMVDDITEQLETQERLSISEKLYRSIFETTGAATIIIDEDMTILMTNEQFEKLTGYAKHEVDGRMKWTEFVKKDDLGKMKDYHRLRRIDPDAPPRNYEFSFFDRFDTEKEILATVSLIPGTKKSVASFLDITDLKHLNKKIQESEKRYRLLAENVSDVIWTMDTNLAFTYISPSVINQRGYSADEAMKQTMREILTAASYDVAMNAFKQETAREQAKQRGLDEPLMLELELTCKDGSTIWADLRMTFLRDREGRISEILGIARDITERKRAEDALRESEERYRALFENVPSGIGLAAMDGRIITCNETMCQITGYSLEQFKEINLLDTYEKPEDREYLLQQIKTDGFIRNFETRLKRKDGTKYYANLTVIPLALDDEEVLLTVAEDITARKEAEEALKRSKDELEIKSLYLEEANTALRVLLKHRETDKEEFQRTVLTNVRELVIPYIDKVRASRSSADRTASLDIVEANLKNIVSPFLSNLSMEQRDLTPKEIQIAHFIKDGKSTKEIAEILHLSLRTINFHRENIRKKLGLTNTRTNLQTYLLSLL